MPDEFVLKNRTGKQHANSPFKLSTFDLRSFEGFFCRKNPLNAELNFPPARASFKLRKQHDALALRQRRSRNSPDEFCRITFPLFKLGRSCRCAFPKLLLQIKRTFVQSKLLFVACFTATTVVREKTHQVVINPRVTFIGNIFFLL